MMQASVLSRYLDPEVLARLAGRQLEPRGLVLGTLAGSRKSPLAGFAVEFAGHREYVPGDDPRHVDWRVFYTRDKYVIKQYEMETNLVCHLVLDVSASMRYGAGDEQKLLYASRAAATLAHAIVRQSDQVSMATFDERVLAFIPPANSAAQVVRLAEHLETIRPVEKTRLAECLMELAARFGRRAVVILFSDFFTDLDALEKALQRFRYAQHEVVLFHVMHHDELTLDFEGPVKFVGLESNDELLTQPDAMRAAYLAAVGRFTGRLDDLCHRNRIERVPVDTRRDLAEVLIDYLNHRSRLNRGR
ncbi:MAG TPA: DUF58 domain-containing protein [Planctomycetaceae bacterium]|nr:DUF58 domain-containing protein [Planctomycetaceae bacterium]